MLHVRRTAIPTYNDEVNGLISALSHLRLIPIFLMVCSAILSGNPAEPQGSEALVEEMVKHQLASLSLEEKIGQLFILDLYDENGRLPVQVDRRVRELIRVYKPGGIILYAGNIRTVDQTVRLVSDLQEMSKVPLIIAVDEEGGLVSRLTRSGEMGATELPAARIVGMTGSEDLAYATGRIMGKELRALGINMNLAPVADILTDPFSSIGSRSFSSDPIQVSNMVSAVVRGIQDEGVSSVLKHYPGHGAISQDTHHGLVVAEHDLQRLEAIELLPFQKGIEAGADGIMTAHIVFPNITRDDLPASFSLFLLEEVLRGKLHHKKLIITDSLVMDAIDEFWGPGDSAVAAVEAGVDIVLRPIDVEAARSAILEAVRAGDISESRIDDSVKRILRVKQSRRIFETSLRREQPREVLGNPEHLAIVERIYRSAENGQ